MSRDQQNQLFKTSTADASTAKQGVQSGLSAFNDRLTSYYGEDPYKAGGEFETANKTINASRANADSNALQNELNLSGKRSGENTASFAPNLVAAQRQSTLDAADAQAKSKAQQLENETRYQQYGIGASQFPVQANEQMYSTAMGQASSAAKQPGLWDTLFEDAIKGASTGGEIAAA